MPPLIPWWKQEQNRLYTWALLCFFSSVALTSYKTNPDHAEKRSNLDYLGWHEWDTLITVCSSISIAISALASLAHGSHNNVFCRRFVGTIVEGSVSFFIVVSWGSVIFLILDPNEDLALKWASSRIGRVADYQQSIQDGNLYFSSWGSLKCALLLVCMYMEEQRERILKCFKISANHSGMGQRYTIKWILLLLASFLVVLNAISLEALFVKPS